MEGGGQECNIYFLSRGISTMSVENVEYNECCFLTETSDICYILNITISKRGDR